MKILLAQINPTVGDIRGNTKKIVDCIAKGKELGAALVVFPEMALCGYPPEDLLLLPHFVKEVEDAIKSIAKSTSGIAAVIGTIRHHEEKGEKALSNSAAVIDNGKLLGFQDKMLLPTYDVFDERRFFEPARQIRLWNIGGKKIGITICEDIWQHGELLKYATYARDPVMEIAALHPDVVINLSASPYSLMKFNDRLQTCSKAATAIKAPLLLCNQVGGNDSLIFDGRSLYVDALGRLIDYSKGFMEDNLLVDLAAKLVPKKYSVAPTEELFNALVLGLKDYFFKSGFTKACLGLSGGVDSALVGCIAVEALGKDNVLGVLMPSRFSSPGSVTDAKQLATALGIKTQEISIEGPFKSYLDGLNPIFKGTESGVAEENIQARIRGMYLMALSNKFGYIVLSTGNKSELAMGYSTLYGDLCGGLAVISDVTKQQVYALSNWINRGKEIIPWNTIHKPPSAELRPNQKDTDTLPDYAIVDNVLQAYVEEHQSVETIAGRFGYPLDVVRDLVGRIHRNEYKRRQSPPGLRISEKAFSVGRRFPIVQGYVR